MKLRFCVICGTNKDLHHHHIIPKSQWRRFFDSMLGTS